jgi:hypothetical protein
MDVTIIVREEASVDAVRFILAQYGVDYTEKGPYLGGVTAHFSVSHLPQQAEQELLPIPGVTIMKQETNA